MILHSLRDLYDRLKENPDYGVAPPGYSLQKITFKVVLRSDGTLLDVQDARRERDGRKTPRQVQVLGETKSSGSGLNPCFLWDNTAYMLGFKPDDSNPQRTKRTFEAFRDKHLSLEEEVGSPAFSTVCRFLEQWSPERAADYTALSEAANGFGVFQIAGQSAFVHEDETVDSWWRRHWEDTEVGEVEGQCLLTGKWTAIARLQPMIKGVWGGRAQASLVGFNEPAYESYGKEQSYNAPVGQRAAFEYGAALNALLDGPMRSRHRMMLGDMTVAFWTERPTLVEDIFAGFAAYGVADRSQDEVQDEGVRRRLEVFLDALRKGVDRCRELEEDVNRTEFYILGLSPNSARLSVRLFLRGSIRQLIENLGRHYADIRVEPQFGEGSGRPDPEFPSIKALLRQTARKEEDVPPLIAGPLLRAIVSGTRYPEGLYYAVVRRIRSDRVLNYVRACVIKGFLARNHNEEVTMSLDTERTDAAYRAGRLFAALEKTQADALGGVGASIRDRFYGAASATPRAVFPRLLRTYQHHLAKMEGGLKVNRERLVQEILDPVTDFPAHLDLVGQGLFALGYYHQMRDFYRKKGSPLQTSD
jgi:CRISPR-associated protein Csd1